MPITVKTIREEFPFPTLKKQLGLPSYETINSVHTKIKSNTASVPSNLGGGTHVLLGLVFDSATYQTLTGSLFAKSHNSSTVPTIPAASSGPVIAQIERAHTEVLREWQETTRADQAL